MQNKYLLFENLGYHELDRLDREKTIFLLSVSLLEEHGPHLPFGVDIFIAEYMVDLLIKAIAEKHPDYTIVRFPPLPVGSGGIRWLGIRVLIQLLVNVDHSLFNIRQFLSAAKHQLQYAGLFKLNFLLRKITDFILFGNEDLTR